MTLVAQFTMTCSYYENHDLQTAYIAARTVASVRFNRITTAKRLISFSTSQERSRQVSLRGRGRFIVLHVIIAHNKPARSNENPFWWNLILNRDQTKAYWRDCNQVSQFDEHYCETCARIFFAHLKVLINSNATCGDILYNCSYSSQQEMEVIRNIARTLFRVILK